MKPQADPIVDSVINQLRKRSDIGYNKYNTTLKDNKLPLKDWLQHAQEEAMDFVLYLERIKDELCSHS